ncbi:hypothetical protein QOZ80_1AG0043710 [Eleusine coracana subsp. coracana]|nr:hypothetical protein QOZ80_1AG0043710 [Eleusine coracana subsp. coracana]
MEGGGGGSGMGGISGGPGLLDAGAQAFYPAVGAPYPVPLQPVPHQLYYTHPCPLAIPPPLPPPMAMSVPMPMAPQTTPGGYSLPASDGLSSRAVVLGLVPPHAQESDVARAMAAFGAIRSVDASAVASEGVATVHFFDIRAAELAVACVRDQHMRQQSRLGQLYAAAAAAWTPPPQPTWVDWQNDDTRGLVLGQAVWAHFAGDLEAGDNRGSLVVLTALPAGVTLADLRKVFQAFGDLKDVRESAQRTSHKFVDFFDTRDAARALAELNGRELFGRRLVIEFTRPSSGPGARRLHNRPIAPPPPRHQAAWRPSSQAASSQPVVTSSSSSTSGKAREGVVLLRRSSARASNVGDRSNKGGNASGTSHERKCKGGGAKNIIATAPSAASASGKQSQSQRQSQTKVATTTSSTGGSGSSNWKGRRSGWEARFLFKDPEAVAGDAAETPETEKDTRTTVMIRNIPNKYSQKLLLNMLDNHCIQSNERIAASGEEAEAQPFSAYDFVYLPIDFNNKCNVGYGFFNLTSPEAAVRLYKAFHRQPWEVYNSRKICQVTYARVQGLEALKEHFKNSKFPCESDEYLPVSFSPPRDGKQLTEPVPIVGRSPAPSSASKSGDTSVDPLAQELMPPPSSSGDGASSTTASTHAPSDRADDDNAADDYDGDEEAEERLVGELRQLGYTD